MMVEELLVVVFGSYHHWILDVTIVMDDTAFYNCVSRGRPVGRPSCVYLIHLLHLKFIDDSFACKCIQRSVLSRGNCGVPT